PECTGHITQLSPYCTAHQNKITGIRWHGTTAEMRTSLEMQHQLRVMGKSAGAEHHRLSGPESYCHVFAGDCFNADNFAFVISNNPVNPMVEQQWYIVAVGPCLELADKFFTVTLFAFRRHGIDKSAADTLVFGQVIHIIYLSLAGPVDFLYRFDRTYVPEEINHSRRRIIIGGDQVVLVFR